MHLPAACFRPASIVAICVESIMSGAFDLPHEATDDLGHVRGVVAAGVVDVDVEDVRTFARLLAGERDHAVPVLGLEQSS